MNNLFQDLRYGLRMLLGKPGFTLAAVLTLALGIGANTMIFSIIDAVLLRPLPYAEPERLVILSETKEQVQNRWVSYPNFLDWQKLNHSFEAMSTIRGSRVTLTGGGEPQSLNARMVGADYFKVMRASPLLGRVFLPEEDKPGTQTVTVLSHEFWQRGFGADPNVIGASIMLDNRAFTVVGVMGPEFQHQGPPPLWVLAGQLAGEGWMMRDNRIAGYVIARLKPEVELQQARADMDAVAAALNEQYPWHNAGHRVRLVSLQENIVGPSRQMLLILFAAVGVVLLIACANVANLLLARGATRQKEIAIRSALGAGRWRVMRQLISESLLLFVIGGASGIFLAGWGAGLLSASQTDVIPRLQGVRIDWRVMVFTLALSLATGIVCGLVPAWQVTRIELQQALKEGGKTSAQGRGGRLRNALVIAEVALALVLLVGAGLLIKSLARLLESEPGFDSSNVLTMQINLPSRKYSDRERIRAFQQQLLERVASLPGVEQAAVSNNLPGLSDGWQNDISPEPYRGVNPGEEINVDWVIVSPDYFAAMRIPILQGRTFTRQEAEGGLPVVLIDDHLARQFWPDGDALGKHLKYDSATPHEIIGIVGNVKHYGSEALPRIKMYTPFGRAWLSNATLSLRLKESEVPAVVAAVTRQLQSLDADLPVTEVTTLEERLAREAAPRRFNTILLSGFAAVALVLAAIGIYGVMTYAVTQRTQEIGVRMALGAQAGDVLRLVVGQAVKLALVGVLIGLTAAFVVTRWMESLLFGVSATDPATFAVIALLLATVAVAASYVPARRATKVDPMVALRCE
jgi:putative ABC transport system permease protein